MLQHCTIASDEEILEYYSSKGWVKGAKFIRGNDENYVDIVDKLIVARDKIVHVEGHKGGSIIQNCSLVQECESV